LFDITVPWGRKKTGWSYMAYWKNTNVLSHGRENAAVGAAEAFLEADWHKEERGAPRLFLFVEIPIN